MKRKLHIRVNKKSPSFSASYTQKWIRIQFSLLCQAPEEKKQKLKEKQLKQKPTEETRKERERERERERKQLSSQPWNLTKPSEKPKPKRARTKDTHAKHYPSSKILVLFSFSFLFFFLLNLSFFLCVKNGANQGYLQARSLWHNLGTFSCFMFSCLKIFGGFPVSVMGMGCERMLIAVSLDPERKRSGGLRTKQAGRGSCRGS